MSRTRPSARHHRGATLIECGVAVAVAAILVGSALPSFQRLRARQATDGHAQELLHDLAYARSTAVAKSQPVRVSFFRENLGSCYVVHTGPASECGCSGAAGATCGGAAKAIKSVWLPASEAVSVRLDARSGRTLTFDPVHGTTSPTATIVVAGAQGQEIRHIVNIMGRVRSCTPAQATWGYPSC